jgi:hypothetical protein
VETKDKVTSSRQTLSLPHEVNPVEKSFGQLGLDHAWFLDGSTVHKTSSHGSNFSSHVLELKTSLTCHTHTYHPQTSCGLFGTALHGEQVSATSQLLQEISRSASILVICWLRPEAKSQAKPGQKKPGQAGPKVWPELAFGLAWVLEKPKPLAWAGAL